MEGLKSVMEKKFVLTLCIAFLSSLATQGNLALGILRTSNGLIRVPGVNPDAYLTTPQLITKYGYPVEVHKVQTGDGYILTLFRIPYGRKSPRAPNKPPILLQHGGTSSSIDFLMNSPEKALGYMLADHGYDVWLGNNRGNGYSDQHIKFSTKDPEFWDYTFDDMAKYEMSAMIDYITSKTGQPKIFYVGYSIGTIMFWTFMSEYPGYNEKIRLAVFLSPSGFQKYSRSALVYVAPVAAPLLHHLSNNRFPVTTSEEFTKRLSTFTAAACSIGIIKITICTTVLFPVFGYDYGQVNKRQYPVILANLPRPTGNRINAQMLQSFLTGHMNKYDWGHEKNLRVYGQPNPPIYDITKVTAPVALFSGANDFISTPRDVQRMARLLPNVALNYQVPYKRFNHLDFTYGKDSDILLYHRILDILSKY